jgi:hypothetical protein
MLHRAVSVQHGLRAEIDRGIEELFDKCAERVGPRELGDLVAEFEVVQNFLHVWREAIEIGLEVCLQLRLARAIAQVAQGKARRVVERLSCGLPKRGVLIGDSRLVEVPLHGEHGLLGRFQHRIQAAKHDHGQDHVTIFAARKEVAKDVVGNAPDEVCDPVEIAVAHACPVLLGLVAGLALGAAAWGAAPLALSRRRSNSSTARTTTTGRPCFSTTTGSDLARSIKRPKPYLASFADMLCMAWPSSESTTVLAILAA